MNSSSPAHSSISTTAIVGGGGGGGSNAALSTDDFHLPCDPMSTHKRKDEAMLVLKSDLMAALDKEVKSLDDDNWKFEGPRSRMHLVSSRGVDAHYDDVMALKLPKCNEFLLNMVESGGRHQ